MAGRRVIAHVAWSDVGKLPVGDDQNSWFQYCPGVHRAVQLAEGLDPPFQLHNEPPASDREAHESEADESL